ncbi:MAG: hypothetical protein V1688_03830 [bacterium]
MAFSTNQQIFEAVEKSKDILITFRKEYNGDNLGGAIALLLFLKKIGKKADIACDGFRIPDGYAFLPQVKNIKSEIDNLRKFIISLDISRTKVDEISYDVKENELDFIVSPKNGFFEESDISSKSSGFKYDLIFAIGTQDLEELGNIYDQDTEFFYKTPIINLDYLASNENFGQINLISLTATSVCDILFNLFAECNKEIIDEDISTALLAGIISATKNFKSNKVTPSTLSIASHLITMGARRSEIVQHLYHARSLATLKLWGRILAHLKNDSAHKLVWSLVKKQDFFSTGAVEENLDDVVEELIANSYEVETVVIIYENTKTPMFVRQLTDQGRLQHENIKTREQEYDGEDEQEEWVESSQEGEQEIEDYVSNKIPQDDIENIEIEQEQEPAQGNNEEIETNGESLSDIKVMIFSLKNINSLELARNFSGAKGNDDKAEFCLSGLTLEQAEEKVIKEVGLQLEKLKTQE